MSKINLQTMEGDIFVVDVEVARISRTISTMLDLLREDEEVEVIRIPFVSTGMMAKVIEWAFAHHGQEDEEESNLQKNDGAGTANGAEAKGNCQPFNIREWKAKYFKEDLSTLSKLIEVAEYLDIPKLERSASKARFDLIRRAWFGGV